MAFDGTLKFDTAIDQGGFKVGLGSLGSLAQAGMSAVTGAVSAASEAVVSLGKQAVEVGQSYESSMAKVAATMGITTETIEDGVNSYDLLSQAAKDAGATTTFSASEAAEALNYLALAGYDAATAADALPAVLDLAAAGALDLQYAADLATDAMASLGIEATSENLTAFGDQMAVTASKANTSVAQLGEAILTVGGTAKSLAGGTDELNASLGVLANRGIKGAEGGTHLRNMILSLSAPTDTAKEALDSLGVSALDADGNMRPLNETFADLDKAMDGMSDGDRASLLSDIFNKTDLAAAQAMMAGCGEEFDNLTAALGDCDGAMAQMADTMNDTLEGDIKSLQSKAEALGITVYESMEAPLRDLAQTGGEYLSVLQKGFENNGITGAVQAAGMVIDEALAKITDMLPDVLEIGAKILTSLLKGLLKNLPKVVEAGTGILTELVGELGKAAPMLSKAGSEIIHTLIKLLVEMVPMLIDAAVAIIESLVEMLADPEMLTGLLDAALAILEKLMGVIGENLGMLIDAAILIVETIAMYLVEHATELVTAAIDLVTAIVDAIFDNTDELLLAAEKIIMALADALLDEENLKKIIDSGGKLVVSLFNGLMNFAGELAGFVANLYESLDKKLKETDWVQLGKDILAGIVNGISNFDLGILNDFKDNWVSGIKDIFGIHSPSKLMRDEIGTNLALGIGEGFEEEMPEVGEEALSAFDGMRQSVEPGAYEALEETSGAIAAERFAVPSNSSTFITNQYTNQYTSNYGGDGGAVPAGGGSPAPGGDIIIPVTIGGQQLDTIVIKAAQIANARSGGMSI